MKLGYEIIKDEMKTIIHIFSVPKSQNSKEEKNFLVTMTTPISSNVNDKNSIFTVRDEDMIFQ